jgi:predicted ATPase/DNA-binding XRE family transcriptional regulator/Tfp pilus assembly protein PilF
MNTAEGEDMEGASQRFGQLLKQRRLAAGLTQEGLAERAGLSVPSISNLERGVAHTPRKETLGLLAAALELTPEEREEFLAAARGRPHAPAPIPALRTPLTPLLGRARELAALSALLHDTNTRLLTVTGAGGVGKTRLALDLALALARDAWDTFPDGLAQIELATVRDPTLVAAVIAGALNVREANQTLFADVLIQRLRDKKLLLLIDNFEHLLGAAPLISDLLATCPGLKILLTSRAPLRLRGEQEYPLSPLALPSAAEAASLATLADVASVRLFVQRARAVHPHFALDASNAGVVAAICARLDGLPLAIELAAARSRVFSPQALLAQLDASRMPVLTGGPRDLPARQRSLRDTFAWSYSLLPLETQAAFRRLAVFAGGATLDATATVCAIRGEHDELAIPTILDAVSTLVEHSLLQRDDGDGDDGDGESHGGPHGGPRFVMLETVREYASELLRARDEEATTSEAHAAYYLALAEGAEQRLQGPEVGAWVSRLEKEIGNLRAALQWAAERGEAERGLRLAVALRRFWDLRGYLSEGRAWLERFLALAGGDSHALPPPARASALNALGVLAAAQSDYPRALLCHEEALALRRRLGDRDGIGSSLNNLALVANNQGAYARAEQHYRESLSIAREIGNTWAVTVVLTNLGHVEMNRGDYQRAVETLAEGLALARQLNDPRRVAGLLLNLGLAYGEQGAYTSAERCLGQALEVSRALGYRHGIAGALQNLGDLAYWQGDLSRARTLCEESLALLEELGERRNLADPLSTLGAIAHRSGDLARASALQQQSLAIRRACDDGRGIAISLRYLAHLALDQGELAQAEQRYRESMMTQQSLEDKRGGIACLEGIAGMLHAQGEVERAVRLYAAASAARAALGVPLAPVERPAHDGLVAALRTSLDKERFLRVWAEGELLTLDEALTVGADANGEAAHDADSSMGPAMSD